MIQTITKPLTFAEFLVWDDGSGQDFELIAGVAVPIAEPNANHEDVADTLCASLLANCTEHNLPYIPKRSKQVRLNTQLGERERSRKPDIVIFAAEEWQRMKTSSIPAAAYVPPPMVVEVVSGNWRDDYLTKLAEYESLGIPEYWIVDYAGLGAIRYIGSPKQPTLSIYQLVEGEYQLKQFRGEEQVESGLFPQLNLSAEQIFAPGLLNNTDI